MVDAAEQCPELRDILSVVRRRFHRSPDWILPGEGKWLSPASGAALPGGYRQGTGVKGNWNQQNSLSTMKHGKVEIGAEILLRISREFGKSIEWLLTG